MKIKTLKSNNMKIVYLHLLYKMSPLTKIESLKESTADRVLHQ